MRISRFVRLAVGAGVVLCVVACGAEDSPDSDDGEDMETGTSDGVIDVEGGETQQEQVEELAVVVEVLEKHLGAVPSSIEGDGWQVAGGQDWSVEEYQRHVTPSPYSCGFRYELWFDLEDGDRPEIYRQAEAAAEELGLTPNQNNNDGVEDPAFTVFVAGSQQERSFAFDAFDIPEGEPLNVSYRAKCSDHSSLDDKRSEILDQRTGLEDT